MINILKQCCCRFFKKISLIRQTLLMSSMMCKNFIWFCNSLRNVLLKKIQFFFKIIKKTQLFFTNYYQLCWHFWVASGVALLMHVQPHTISGWVIFWWDFKIKIFFPVLKQQRRACRLDDVLKIDFLLDLTVMITKRKFFLCLWNIQMVLKLDSQNQNWNWVCIVHSKVKFLQIWEAKGHFCWAPQEKWMLILYLM